MGATVRDKSSTASSLANRPRFDRILLDQTSQFIVIFQGLADLLVQRLTSTSDPPNFRRQLCDGDLPRQCVSVERCHERQHLKTLRHGSGFDDIEKLSNNLNDFVLLRAENVHCPQALRTRAV